MSGDNLQEWVVTLWRHEDLEEFYEDLETEGGSLYIPNRKVESVIKRPTSRNTHYLLTLEEAQEVRKDERVRAVELAESIQMVQEGRTYPQTRTFAKTNSGATGTFRDGVLLTLYRTSLGFGEYADWMNWGVYKAVEPNISSADEATWSASTWNGYGGQLQSREINLTATGKNVDVLVYDFSGVMDSTEWYEDDSKTGTSRLNLTHNWWANASNYSENTPNATYDYAVGSYANQGHGPNPSYNYDGYHAQGNASIIGGRRYGVAPDVNLYTLANSCATDMGLSNASYYAGIAWDVIREWHNAKAVNSDTGHTNPTVISMPLGSPRYVGLGIYNITYRGVNFAPVDGEGNPRILTLEELHDRGFPSYSVTSNTGFNHPSYFASTVSDMEDAIADGIIIINSAGNDNFKMTNDPADPDYNNSYIDQYGQTIYYMRGKDSVQAGATVAGAIGATADYRKCEFSNWGDAVTVFTSGIWCMGQYQSDVVFNQSDPSNQMNFPIPDQRNDATYDTIGFTSGTSFACPMVAGFVALFMEMYPQATQSEVNTWLKNGSYKNEMFDEGLPPSSDPSFSIDGSNRILAWQNIRPVDGATYPLNNYSAGGRPESGAVYPLRNVVRYG